MTEDEARARGWKRERCFCCHGTGMVSDYGAFGEDFLGPKECDCCGGGGSYWVTPSGKAHAIWPGGPFC